MPQSFSAFRNYFFCVERVPEGQAIKMTIIRGGEHIDTEAPAPRPVF
jgi:hypothetical protein